MQNAMTNIEKTLGYTFKNRALLVQAFTRRSYTQENGGENNELLEFIGDKVLDVTVVKILSENLGAIGESGEYRDMTGKGEGGYTKIKAGLVERKSLAARMGELDLARFLRMGRGDALNGIDRQDKVREDLFEAIIGAVALDSGWDMAATARVVERMLAIDDLSTLADFEENPIALVQDYMQKEYGITPEYTYVFDEDTALFTATLPIRYRDSRTDITGQGASKSIAKTEAARAALSFIREQAPYDDEYDCSPVTTFGFGRDFGAPVTTPYDLEGAINRLQELAQKGYIEMPVYDSTSVGESHTPVWTVTCSLPSRGLTVSARSSVKKEAKKKAAAAMLEKLSHL